LLLVLISACTLRGQEVERHVHETFQLARISSPQQVWQSLIELADVYAEIIKSEGYTPDNAELLYSIEKQMTKLYDMRDVPPSLRETTAVEATVYIREAMARFRELPDGALPGREEAFAQMKAGLPPMWSINDTDLVIIYVDSGKFLGSFQFSERTLEFADDMYHYTRKLTYQDADIAGFHDAYFLTPGPLISSELIRKLPGWMQTSFLNQNVWQWLCLIVGFILLLTTLTLIFWALSVTTRNWLPIIRGCTRLLMPLSAMWLTTLFVEALDNQVFISGGVLQFLYYIDECVELVSLMMIVIILGNTLIGIIQRRTEGKSVSVDTQLLRFAIRIGTMLVAMLVFVQGLSRMGVPLATVLTGAGVTGLAIALAAQESLRNIFGSMMILLDKPFKVGQRIVIKGHDGKVEGIGLRSTKIRLKNGHLTSIPNDTVAKLDIENIGERPFIKRTLNVTITYDTPLEKIDEAQAIIKDILAVKEHDGKTINEAVNQEPLLPRVAFNDLNSDSLNIIVLYWYQPPEYFEYMEHAVYVNREIIRRFNEAGIKFAFPTSTVHLQHDSQRREVSTPSEAQSNS